MIVRHVAAVLTGPVVSAAIGVLAGLSADATVRLELLRRRAG